MCAFMNSITRRSSNDVNWRSKKLGDTPVRKSSGSNLNSGNEGDGLLKLEPGRKLESGDKGSALKSSDFKSNYSTDIDSLRKINNFLSTWLEAEDEEKSQTARRLDVEDKIGEIIQDSIKTSHLLSTESKKSMPYQSKSPGPGKKVTSFSSEKKNLKQAIGMKHFSPCVDKKLNTSSIVAKKKKHLFSNSFEMNMTLDALMENKEELISKVYAIKQPQSKLIPAMKTQARTNEEKNKERTIAATKTLFEQQMRRIETEIKRTETEMKKGRGKGAYFDKVLEQQRKELASAQRELNEFRCSIMANRLEFFRRKFLSEVCPFFWEKLHKFLEEKDQQLSDFLQIGHQRTLQKCFAAWKQFQIDAIETKRAKALIEEKMKEDDMMNTAQIFWERNKMDYYWKVWMKFMQIRKKERERDLKNKGIKRKIDNFIEDQVTHLDRKHQAQTGLNNSSSFISQNSSAIRNTRDRKNMARINSESFSQSPNKVSKARALDKTPPSTNRSRTRDSAGSKLVRTEPEQQEKKVAKKPTEETPRNHKISVSPQPENLRLEDESEEVFAEQINTNIPTPISHDLLMDSTEIADKLRNKTAAVSPKTNLSKPSLKELEKRAAERRERSAINKKRHEEIKEQKKQDKIQLEEREQIESKVRKSDDKKLRDSKKKKDTDPRTQKSAEEPFFTESHPKFEIALQHDRTRLKKFYGLKPMKKLLRAAQEQIGRARSYRARAMKRSGFLALRKNLDSETLQDSQQWQKAVAHRNINLKLNVFNSFLQNYVSSFEENEKLQRVRNDYLKRTCFQSWFKIMGSLKDEKEDDDYESQYEEIISRFRWVILCEKVVRGWKGLARSSKKHGSTQGSKKIRASSHSKK